MPDNVSGALASVSGIGSLRWLVRLYRRDQEPAAGGGIAERFNLIAKVQADVQPTYPSTHYLSAQVDTPVTHLIRVRWQDYLENVNVITRRTHRPSDQTIRAELFRVRRTKEIAGRKRFIELECELERTATATSDSDAEDELLFAESPTIN